ncbi:hypothetical protein VKS41_004590 [Umbelopsis sp. WA50703]
MYSKDYCDEDDVEGDDEGDNEDNDEDDHNHDEEEEQEQEIENHQEVIDAKNVVDYAAEERAQEVVELEDEQEDDKAGQQEVKKQGCDTTITQEVLNENLESNEERSATSCEPSTVERPLPQQGYFSDTDVETEAQAEYDDNTDETQNGIVVSHVQKDDALKEINSDVGDDADTDNNGGNNTHACEHEDTESESVSEHSEVDITPSGKQIESMPYPSPRKQEKVVADVLKHKMSQGQSFMEATTAIFKEGIQGIEAAVINRVLGEKSVTPIKRTTHRVPSFKAKRANTRFNRRLRRERQQQAISEEKERHGSKSNTEGFIQSKGLSKLAIKDVAARSRHESQRSNLNHSPLQKFAKSQKQTSLRKAANMPRGNLETSEKKNNPNIRSSKRDSDPDSSEYDSGTERARQDLEVFLRRKAGSKDKTTNKGA